MRKALLNALPVDFVTSQLGNYMNSPTDYSVSETVALVRLASGLITRMNEELILKDNGSLQS